MSRDPFEELFGVAPREPEPQPDTEPQPVPARARLGQEQAERVRTAQLDVDGERKKRSASAVAALPWIIVGAIAIVALVVSMVLISSSRDGGEPEATAAPEPTTTAPTTQAPTETPKPTTPAEEDEDKEKKPEGDEPPVVAVDSTMTMWIDQWGVNSELSSRFGPTSYRLENNNSDLVLTSDLLNMFPESCAAMRQGFGAHRAESGEYSVLKPAESCADAPELYTEVWGLLAAWVKTFN